MTDTVLDAGARAARLLHHEKEALARAVTDALYAERPELVEKHGERGREKCLADMRHNVNHLAPAVELGDAEMFARYVTWLDGLLRARSVDTRDVVRSLELLRAECGARFPGEEARATAAIIDAGLRVVHA